MAEDKKPEQESGARPATRKKPAAKKAAKKKTAAKTSAKKTATRKTTPRKKTPAKRATVATPAPTSPPADTPAEIPKAAPQPPPMAASSASEYAYEADDEGSGMSGLLVTAGPLIILGFLILVMSNDRTPTTPQGSEATVAGALIPAPAPVTASPGLTKESLKQLVTDDAAQELSEAFKEAGIKLPAEAQEQPRPADTEPLEIPAELQTNPWAPQPPGEQRAAENAPPPPPAAYAGQRPPPWGYPGRMPGYNPYMGNPYMNPYTGYPWQPPPGYGMPMNPYAAPMPGYGYGMPPGGYMRGRMHGAPMPRGGGQAMPPGDEPPAPATGATNPAPG